jgi:hypothetical protein
MALSITPPDISSLREETTNQFLDRRERELTAQISALNGQIAPKEAELLQVRRVKAALKLDADLSKSLSGETEPTANHPVVSFDYDAALTNVIGGRSMPPYHTMTIKELVIQALLDHFPLGAAAALIREFIRDAYSRGIEPSSLRAQMHRLKADKILQHDAAKDIWDFATGKRALYDTYRQVPKATPELRDNNPEDDDDALLRAAEQLAWDGDGFAEKQASNKPPEAKPPGGIKRRVF